MSHVSDFRLLLPCTWDLRPSVMLRSVDWYLPTFRQNFLVPSSRVKQPKRNYSWIAWSLKREPCRLSWNVGDYPSTLRNMAEERRARVQNVRISPTECICVFISVRKIMSNRWSRWLTEMWCIFVFDEKWIFKYYWRILFPGHPG